MTIAHWTPPVGPTRQEQFILKRLGRVRKLLGFLRLHRHELFDAAFQDELIAMYRTTGAGKEARPPAMMAMAILVQGYLGISDAEMIELTVLDLRVQMVLGCLGAEEPPFSQGALQEFRERVIAADLDRRLLERTIELAKQTKAFDHRKLPKTLRVAIDSSPLAGAGRVEDTFNLLAHAARNVVSCAAGLLGWTDEKVCRQGASRCSWSRALSAPSTSTGTMPPRRPRRSRPSRANLTRCTRGSHDNSLRKSHSRRSRRTSRPSCRSGRRILSPILLAGVFAFAREWRRIAGSRSRTRRCVTAGRVRASGSTDSSGTLPRTSIVG